MSDLPEINFKEKKDKKKGFLPWLRSRLGFGGRSALGEAGEAASGAANLGRATFGAARFGASSGLGGLLAGKFGLIATIAIVGAALGTTLYMKNASSPMTGAAAFNSNSRTPDNYVPAILRDTKNQGSSLEMFKDTNKGAVSMDENEAAKDESADASKDKPAPAEKTAADANAPAPGQGNMEQEMMAKMAGGFGGGLSTSMGSGDAKVSGMGGFGNKFNSGAVGKQSAFGNIGSSFQTSPKFDQRRKLLAMSTSKRPVFSSAKGGKSGPFGKGSYAQAKGLRATQKTGMGSSADQQRSTQDKAWEGATADGTAAGGAGVTAGQGGSGIVTSPSLDNTNTSGGGGTQTDPVMNDTPTATDVSPWAGLPQKAMMLIMLSAMLSAIGGWVVQLGQKLMAVPYTASIGAFVYGIGILICTIALAVAAMAIMIGVKLMSTYGQSMLGGIYTLGGGVATAAAIMAMTGASIGPITPLWMAAIAGILGLLGSMAGGK